MCSVLKLDLERGVLVGLFILKEKNPFRLKILYKDQFFRVALLNFPAFIFHFTSHRYLQIALTAGYPPCAFGRYSGEPAII